MEGCFLFGSQESSNPSSNFSQCLGSYPNNSDQIYSTNDQDYLYQDLIINIFDMENGKPSFTINRFDGKILRESFPNDKFFTDKSDGNLIINYEIEPKVGGVDIVYTVYNPTNTVQEIPQFEISGFHQAFNGEICRLNPKDSGTMEPINLENDSFGYIYPGVYSPVIVLHDEEDALGTSIQFPLLEYKHDVNMVLKKITEGAQAGTWRHIYRKGNSYSYIPVHNSEEDTWEYRITVRFAEKRNWLLTLHPYKDFFNNIYEEFSVDSPPDLRPIYRRNVSSKGDFHEIENPRGYNDNLEIHIPEIGWQNFILDVLQDMNTRGYERFVLWNPSGTYQNDNGCNFPPQFMDFLPHLAGEEEGGNDFYFNVFEPSGINLGFWWGRSAQIPFGYDGNGWNPAGCVDASYQNQGNLNFLNGQLDQALARGAKTLGLDHFTNMPPWDKFLWVEDMMNRASNQGTDILLVHEDSGADFFHSKMANWYNPDRWNRPVQFGPDLLSRYLNGPSEIWVIFKTDNFPYNQEIMQTHIRWGFTPVPTSNLDAFDILSLDYTLVQCFDGIDNDNDGVTDFPYDLDCLSATDESEG